MYTPSITGYPLVTYSNATESEPVLGWRTQYSEYSIMNAIVNVYEAPASYAMPESATSIKASRLAGISKTDYVIKLSDIILVCAGPNGEQRYFWLSSNRGGVEIYVWMSEADVVSWIKSINSFSFLVYSAPSASVKIRIPGFVATVSSFAQKNGDVAVWRGALFDLPFCNGFVQIVLAAMGWLTEKINKILSCQYPKTANQQFRYVESLWGINPKFVRWLGGPTGSQKVANARFTDPTNIAQKSGVRKFFEDPITGASNYVTSVLKSDYVHAVVPIALDLAPTASTEAEAAALDAQLVGRQSAKYPVDSQFVDMDIAMRNGISNNMRPDFKYEYSSNGPLGVDLHVA